MVLFIDVVLTFLFSGFQMVFFATESIRKKRSQDRLLANRNENDLLLFIQDMKLRSNQMK